MKKILVSLLCVVMMVTFMPSMAFAAEADENNTEGTTEKVAIIEQTGVEYATLGEAVENVIDGQTIKLLKDIDFDNSRITIDKSITLDLNGKR